MYYYLTNDYRRDTHTHGITIPNSNTLRAMHDHVRADDMLATLPAPARLRIMRAHKREAEERLLHAVLTGEL